MEAGLLPYIDLLEKGKGGYYICPRCKEAKLSINKKNGAHECYSCNATKSLILQALGVSSEAPPSPKVESRAERIAKAVTAVAAEAGAFNSPEDWMPDREPEQQPQTQVDETGEELGELSELQALKCPQVLPERLLAPMRRLASRLNVPVEAYVASLLAVAASQIASETRLELDPATNFNVPPVLWIGVVGESGSKKSPALRAVISPLDRLQQEAELEYQANFKHYETDLEKWELEEKGKRGPRPKPPSPKEHYFSDFTLEALAGVLGTQSDQGLLILIDELARFFSSMDAYRNGKGGDRQTWLSLYDGGSFKVNRKGSGRVYSPKTSVSLLGGIQPAIIQKIMMGDASQEDGLWSRFAWVRIPLSISQGIQGGSCDLSPLLSGLYRDLSQLYQFLKVRLQITPQGWRFFPQ